MPIPADLAVEVLSPNDRFKDVADKVKEYLKAGFGLVWVVNPYWRHVHVYRPDGSVQLVNEHEEISGESALPSFRCKVAEFFDV
jgi:Uma2 family endonuclease